jgi:serine/threonine kinase 16
MREVDAYRLFAHVDGIIHMVDHAVAIDRGGGTSGIGSTGAGSSDDARTVYILLPYYRRGNLQDVINANLVNKTQFPERRLLVLFLGVCRALRQMHKYSPPAPGSTAIERMEMGDELAAASRAPGRRHPSDSVPEEAEQPLMENEHRVGGAEVRSYAHRDIKPGKSCIADIFHGRGRLLFNSRSC